MTESALQSAVISERQLSDAVAELAQRLGWLGYHTFDSRRSASGFPDWVFVRKERLIFAELKSAVGQVTHKQREWIDALRACEQHAITRSYRTYAEPSCVEVYTWRPGDWQRGTIERVLQGAA